ncbi:MAG: DUF502 domain-containing protein [Planctomycetaceae bacterium]
MSVPKATEMVVAPRPPGTFRGAILRGLGVLLPPLLTIVVLIWAWNAISNYVLRPMETGVRYAVVWGIGDIKRTAPQGAVATDGASRLNGFTYNDVRYVPDRTGRRFLPEHVIRYVEDNLDRLGPYEPSPTTATAYWHRYVEMRYLPRSFIVPLFLLVFLTVLYFLGKVFAHGIGRWVVTSFEAGINRIPIVNKVYGSVKQVTDFAFSEREIEFNRVVAVEYPRKGIWSIGFVTGNGLPEISVVAGEPMLAILMPTSPMPMTGFTIQVPRSQAVDLQLTIDEAIQFVVSCGVVVAGGPQGGQPQPIRIAADDLNR